MFATTLLTMFAWFGAALCGAEPATPTQSSEQRIREALAETVELDAVDMPLSEALRHLTRDRDFCMVIDEASLRESGVDPHTPITGYYLGIALRSLLRLMLADLDSDYLIHEGVLLITTRDRAESEQEAHAYYVGDLIDARQSRSDLVECLAATVAPESWGERSGPLEGVRFVGCVMTVRQSQAVHEKIDKFLTSIRAARAGVHPEVRVTPTHSS